MSDGDNEDEHDETDFSIVDILARISEDLSGIDEQLRSTQTSLAASVNQAGIQESLERMNVNLNEMWNSIDSEALAQAIDSIQKEKELAEAITDGISDFDPPESYDADSVVVSDKAREVGKNTLQTFIEVIDEGDSEFEQLQPYKERLQSGLDAFESERYIEAVFVFISVRDGLMTVIADSQGMSPNGSYYRRSQKEDALENTVENHPLGLVDPEDVVDAVNDFYAHRNVIMHGGPNAHFDDKIAAISLLLLMLTLYSTLNELS